MLCIYTNRFVLVDSFLLLLMYIFDICIVKVVEVVSGNLMSQDKLIITV